MENYRRVIQVSRWCSNFGDEISHLTIKIEVSLDLRIAILSPWRNLFASSGFPPLAFSNMTEIQAECVVNRTQGGGFHVHKRQTSLALCWKQQELL
ncbi:hypothetical protein KY284_021055 [Solanum tuberosum]|nr:hypothetical protein KY284_021055 [Solanum tuberosum]